MNPPIAHSANTAGVTHDLQAHLTDVARLAAEFARPFGSERYAEATGLLHDLGKNAADFQARLGNDPEATAESRPGKVDHSSAGAVYALERMAPPGREPKYAADVLGREPGVLLALPIAGHHCGLDDLTSLAGRLAEKRYRLADALREPNCFVPEIGPLSLPDFLKPRPCKTQNERDAYKRQFEFWVRMLFSCLVDADWLDTERHFDGTKADTREGGRAGMPELLSRFDEFMSNKAAGAGTGGVNETRQRVLADCRERAADPPGVFTLTAPTGAGKTLAGMGFALEHAVRHGKERVIVVIPYTSIIDQNAAVYRAVFGPDDVIDHHASLDPATESARNKLAAENWDAPIVVTTSVQFLESLFANKPSRCRKLHNVCNSVVIFDEVQTLPVGHLLPIVDVLKELVANYKVSLVLSTATQPALGVRPTLTGHTFPGFERTTEIVSGVKPTFDQLRRVDVRFDPAPMADWRSLADDVTNEPEDVLVINHLRKDARELAELVPGSLHLSALMCPKHRLKRLDEIRRQLTANRARRAAGEAVEPLRVVTTQLVEAGVDLDFPVVYRAFAGFDSVAQAAGRCNREGLLRHPDGTPRRGRVRVFRPPTQPPKGVLRDAQGVAGAMLAADPALDPLDPDLYERYFARLYGGKESDKAGIQALRFDWKFRQVAEAFRLIEDDWSEAVVVPYDEAVVALIDRLRRGGPDAVTREVFRRLQPYTVAVPRQVVRSPAAQAVFVPNLLGTLNAILPECENLYDERFGLKLDGPLAYDPAALVR